MGRRIFEITKVEELRHCAEKKVIWSTNQAVFIV